MSSPHCHCSTQYKALRIGSALNVTDCNDEVVTINILIENTAISLDASEAKSLKLAREGFIPFSARLFEAVKCFLKLPDSVGSGPIAGRRSHIDLLVELPIQEG